MNKTGRLLTAALSLSLLGGYCVSAADGGFDGKAGGVSIPDSVKNIKDQAPGAGAAVPVPATAPVSGDFAQFLANANYDDICKNAQLRLNQEAKLASDIVGLGGLYGRYLRTLPSGKVALIDEVGVKLGVNIGRATMGLPALPVDGLSYSVNLTAILEGRSSVVRPLDSDRYCKELKTLVKLYDVKTILPINAKRVRAMEKGEIWKLPVSFRYGFGASISGTFNEAVVVTLSGGINKELKPSVSLYRMEQNKLRLRVRIDNVFIQSVGVSATTLSIPAGDMGLPETEELITRLVTKQLAREINRFIAFKLGYQYSHVSGKKLLLEFIVDPDNEQQLSGLIDFLRGDFGILKRFMELGVNFHRFKLETEVATGLDDITDLSDLATSSLGSAATFAGSDHYTGHNNNFTINIPLIHRNATTWTTGYNRYQSLEKQGETLHLQEKTKASNTSSFLGYTKQNYRKSAYVFNREAAGGKVTRPVFFYQKYESIANKSDGTAREMLENANGVLKYAGVQGNGTNPAFTVPSEAIFPRAEKDPDAGPEDGPAYKSYRSAVTSFKLAISGAGVQEILFAPARAIMKAYMNVMRETSGAIIDKVMHLFTVDEKGKVDYDYHEVQRALNATPYDNQDGGTNPLDIVHTLAYNATRVIADIAGIKNETNWKAQSEKLAGVAAGGGKSGLTYEDFLKVVIQMVEPRNLSAEVYVHTDKKVKGERDHNESYPFFNNRDNNFDSTLEDVTQMRSRFLAPTDVTD